MQDPATEILKQTKPIDFHTMYQQSLLRQQVKLELKPATPLIVYNMLQDMRHLVIVDFIDDYTKRHVRRSLKVDLSNWMQTVV